MVDSLITLYGETETEFVSNGLGNLSDATSCQVREERNGEYELEMEYPITGAHYLEIGKRSIIFCKPNPYTQAQPFRVYNVSRPSNGIVTISAHHISYDLSGYPIEPFKTSDLASTFTEVNRQMTTALNSNKPKFTFSQDFASTTTGIELLTPCSARLLLGGSEGSILDRHHGEYEWDRWNVIFHEKRGVDAGATIEYGKNLTDLTQEENCDEVWTAVYPFWYSDDGGLVELGTGRNKLIQCEGTYEHERIYILDLSSEFTEKPTVAQLREAADQYVKDNELGSPKVSLTVSFVALEDTVNYANMKAFQKVKLCDTVHVYFPALNVYSTSKCIATTYNVLTNKYVEIELGDPKSDLASTISGQGIAMNDVPTTALMTRIVEQQTKTITGNNGGFFLIHDSDGDGKPDECLWMDTDSITTAKKVLRINKSGIGFSANGYNGQYSTAWTLDGRFNASFIYGGTLTLGGADNGNGVLQIVDANGKQIGKIDSTGLYFGPNKEFYVDNSGTGTFKGNVYAKNISVGTNEGYISSGQIGTGQVTSGNIGGGAVTESKIGGGAVTNSKLGASSVDNSKLQSSSVYDSTIASGAGIQKGKLSQEVQNILADVASIRLMVTTSISTQTIYANEGHFAQLWVNLIEAKWKNTTVSTPSGSTTLRYLGL